MDFSQLESIAGKLGLSEEMIQKMSQGLDEKIRSGEIDEKEAKKIEKKCAKSAKTLDKLTQKLEKKGIAMPDLSSIMSMIPQDFDPSSVDMSQFQNMDPSMLSNLDPSMLEGMGFDMGGMSAEDLQEMAGAFFGNNDDDEE